MVDQDGFTFEEVVVERGSVRALDGFSAHIPATGITVLFGPSGSGKTTVLRLCNRLEVPTAGRVCLSGADLAGLDPLRLRRRVGMVFQRPTPFPGTVRDNLTAAAPDAPAEELERALRRAALDGSWLDRDAGELSGGEAQRVCLARTLVTGPDTLLLDEPTSSLDASAARQIEDTVRELTRDGISALWVSHDPRQVRRIADAVVGIERGRRVEPDLGEAT
ncbi:phosphate ABC transporter ATP-binding protein [Actinophytocola sp.]|uniref:ABC transporter ATP-binding protein n=1 Tax=Actinophytocola sp. TaxID=1872138 RepID=UPI002D80DD03|nr:phosphate ABC transporter ATP-binding protein [Actinophytocola sp.]HET9143371.1 phosphate ABC transporter ATP-binding protein [Actinophytocola sp.]HEU5110540.1 phosphate ABC transporter ATP-binding protein [Micromonosporaceae bacterium]